MIRIVGAFVCAIAVASALVPRVAPVAEARSAPAPSASPKLSKWQQHQLELYNASAPADEYFGRMKMSYLGMNNTFHDTAITAGEHTTDPAIAAKVAFAEEALEAWARKYPRDPQLARTYFLATVVERKIWLKPNQERAWIYLKRLTELFPDTYFGKLVKKDIAIGFTEHYYANPEPCPTASPSPAYVAAALTAIGDPTPAPSPTPLASPTPQVLEKGLSVVVLPQPCVPPATPSPSPSPSPVTLPSAMPSGPIVPSASVSAAPARS